MSAATWITMILIMALIWGGFAALLRLAFRNESEKSGSGGNHG